MATPRTLGFGFLILCLSSLTSDALGGRPRGNLGAIPDRPGNDEKVFNVLSFGAKVGSKDEESNSMAFIQAWNAACHWKGKARLVIPLGEFLIGPVIFQGPCSAPIIVQLIGTLKASTDISLYDSDQWISFERIDGLTVTGGGTFHGQGEAQWKLNDCHSNPNCQLLPVSVRFSHVTNGIIRRVNSVNSKGFHYTLYACNTFRAKRLHITAPGDSPNTDGIHISNSTNVKIAKSVIGTGDDCISIGRGSVNININKITCGPGHGISVGSLGKYQHEEDVQGISVKNCTLSNTTNGVRIKTWPNSPPSQASSFLFQNIVMNNVENPIIIDQEYCAKSNCKGKAPSRVKISNVHYQNIRGTTSSEVAVKIMCSSQFPCQNVNLYNIDLKYAGPVTSSKQVAAATSACANAQLAYTGVQNPPPCRH